MKYESISGLSASHSTRIKNLPCVAAYKSSPRRQLELLGREFTYESHCSIFLFKALSTVLNCLIVLNTFLCQLLRLLFPFFTSIMDLLVAQYGRPAFQEEGYSSQEQQELSETMPPLSLRFAMPPVAKVSHSGSYDYIICMGTGEANVVSTALSLSAGSNR